jgi:hypothetical protein
MCLGGSSLSQVGGNEWASGATKADREAAVLLGAVPRVGADAGSGYAWSDRPGFVWRAGSAGCERPSTGLRAA